MARSFRKLPISGRTRAESEKSDKQMANRKFRRRNKQAINSTDNNSVGDKLNVKPKEAYDMQWAGSKDGKVFYDGIKHCRESLRK